MKTILITGAAGGLGICLVREYLSRGYRVFGADIRKRPDTDKLLAEADGNYLFFETDVSDSASVGQLAAKVSAETESLDIIINAAGILRPESENVLEEFDIDGSRKLFDVNALGPLRVVKACIGLLRKGNEKLLINISSEAGSMTTHADYINRYDYCMSKAALNIQSIILQRYVKPEGIRVLLFNPGWMHTPMGGPNAPINPADSARGIADVAENLRNKPRSSDKAESDMFWNYDGTERPW
jgi:NAD(P)-dependent dehydrogenase (short-subunit alcohol dehydrogenase family)